MRSILLPLLLGGLFICVQSFSQAPAQKRPGSPPPPHTGKLEVQVDQDVTYGPSADEPRWKLDVYRPKREAGAKPAPAIIFFHGGGWSAGSKAGFSWYATEAATLGYVAFSANYRLAPQHHYPAAYDDVQRAVRWVRAHAEEYRLDPKRIGVVGSSAGGHLVAMLGATDTRDNSDSKLSAFSSRPTCVVDYFGPANFVYMVGRPVADKGAVVQFIGKPSTEAPELWAEASPITHVSARSAPLLAIHGTADTTVPIAQSEELVEKLKAAGVEASLLRVEGAGHGFHNQIATENAQRAWKTALDFFSRCLK